MNENRPAHISLVSCMKNEGMFVVEWLAHHLGLGFDRVTVFTNDCTDGTDALLSRLQELGYVRHIDHAPPPGSSPQISAMGIAMSDPTITNTDWLLHIDADEFVDVVEGDIHDFVARFGDQADIIALFWKLFGDNGIEKWEGGSVVQQFSRAQDRPMRRVVHHKSLFRPSRFGRCTDHMPKDPRTKDVRVINTRGERLPNTSVFHRSKSRYKAKFHQLTFDNACLNHYSIKSRDLFLMKNHRGDGHGVAHTRYHLGSELHRNYNRNEIEDRQILRHAPKTAAIMARIREDAGVRALEAQAMKLYVETRDRVLTPEQIDAWTLKTETEGVSR